MDFGAVLDGCCPGMRRVLGTCWWRDAEFGERFLYVAWHGEVDCSCVVVPFQSDSFPDSLPSQSSVALYKSCRTDPRSSACFLPTYLTLKSSTSISAKEIGHASWMNRHGVRAAG